VVVPVVPVVVPVVDPALDVPASGEGCLHVSRLCPLMASEELSTVSLLGAVQAAAPSTNQIPARRWLVIMPSLLRPLAKHVTDHARIARIDATRALHAIARTLAEYDLTNTMFKALNNEVPPQAGRHPEGDLDEDLR
jgi:hypothetical protein